MINIKSHNHTWELFPSCSTHAELSVFAQAANSISLNFSTVFLQIYPAYFKDLISLNFQQYFSEISSIFQQSDFFKSSNLRIFLAYFKYSTKMIFLQREKPPVLINGWGCFSRIWTLYNRDWTEPWQPCEHPPSPQARVTSMNSMMKLSCFKPFNPPCTLSNIVSILKGNVAKNYCCRFFVLSRSCLVIQVVNQEISIKDFFKIKCPFDPCFLRSLLTAPHCPSSCSWS